MISALQPTARIAGTRASVWSSGSMSQPSSPRQRSAVRSERATFEPMNVVVFQGGQSCSCGPRTLLAPLAAALDPGQRCSWFLAHDAAAHRCRAISGAPALALPLPLLYLHFLPLEIGGCSVKHWNVLEIHVFHSRPRVDHTRWWTECQVISTRDRSTARRVRRRRIAARSSLSTAPHCGCSRPSGSACCCCCCCVAARVCPACSASPRAARRIGR